MELVYPNGDTKIFEVHPDDIVLIEDGVSIRFTTNLRIQFTLCAFLTERETINGFFQQQSLKILYYILYIMQKKD